MTRKLFWSDPYRTRLASRIAAVSGDEVTVHWDEDCACGWKSPRVEKTIRRLSQSEGGEDKITCAGSQQAYNEFMDYVMGE